MGEYSDKAKELRPIIEKAVETGALTPEEQETATNLFPSWDGNGKAYAVDDLVQYDNLLWKCVQAHTSQPDWMPGTAPSLWSRASDPGEEWPEWIQPTGGHDAYAAGAKVSHNGKHWISTVDGNVWEPPTMWEEQA